MALDQIKKLLQETMGLNSNTVGSSNFERAVRQRMKVRQIDNATDYHIFLKRSEPELRELIEEVVVPETWFYRNHVSFSALEEYVKIEWVEKKKQDVLRTLSVPCSTGEEPYTIAMTYDQVGIPEEMIHIDAVDISTQVLIKAKRGIYNRNSFRNKENPFREKYFTKEGDNYRLDKRIKSLVNFQHGNLLDKYFGISRQRYDIIFCRNLLIYFDRQTQECAIDKLHKMLNHDGILFLGHAETGEVINKYFKRANYSKAFAYEKLQPEVEVKKNKTVNFIDRSSIPTTGISQEQNKLQVCHLDTPAAKVIQRDKPGIKKGKGNKNREKIVPIVKSNSVPVKRKKNNCDALDTISQLANEGSLDKAAVLCTEYIRENDTSAQAYYLMGVIKKAQGKYEEVSDLFKKAVYLDPDHHEAMVHLALHTEQMGDMETAQKLHTRARRVLKRKKE